MPEPYILEKAIILVEDKESFFMDRPAPTLGNPQNTIAVLNQYGFVFQKNTDRIFLLIRMY